MYVLIGLYLITPLLRVIVAHAEWSTIKYFLILWFVGTGILPLLTFYVSISPQAVWFRQNVFLLVGLLGYFVLGAYIAKLTLRRSTLVLMLTLSTVFTIVGTYFLIASLGEQYSQFFLDASSFSVIIASVSLFLILASIPNQKIETRFPRAIKSYKLLVKIHLPIYLFHIIVLETLQKGYLGLKNKCNKH